MAPLKRATDGDWQSRRTACTVAGAMSDPTDMPSAVVLLSGGLDSATTLAIARAKGFRCHALSFDYGQRNRIELAAAARAAESLQAASHRVVRLDLRGQAGFGRSALTDAIAVPKDRPDQPAGEESSLVWDR